MDIQIEYELDQWDWQGVTRSVDIDPEDFEGLSEREIRNRLHELICEDGHKHTHFVYPEGEIVSQIKEALAEAEKEG